jgi:hypothetical protein
VSTLVSGQVALKSDRTRASSGYLDQVINTGSLHLKNGSFAVTSDLRVLGGIVRLLGNCRETSGRIISMGEAKVQEGCAADGNY